MSNSPFSKSNSVGNVVGLKGRNIDKTTLREELLHNWQYRRGGFLNLSILIHEQRNKKGDYPYYTSGTLEHEASNLSTHGGDRPKYYSNSEDIYYDGRNQPIPWELTCSSCGRFF